LKEKRASPPYVKKKNLVHVMWVKMAVVPVDELAGCHPQGGAGEAQNIERRHTETQDTGIKNYPALEEDT